MSLHVRIAAGVIFAVVVGWAAAASSLAQLRGQMALEPPDYLAGNGLLWIAAQLDALPESLWNERPAEVRPYIDASRDRLAAMCRGACYAVFQHRSRSSSRPEIGPPSIYMPLHAGTLSGGGPPPPPPPPPLMPLLAGALIFVLALTATASAAVGIPSFAGCEACRTRSANWEAATGGAARRERRGGLSDLAESINRTAAQLQQQFQEREALLQVVSHEIVARCSPHAVSGRDAGGRDSTAEPEEPPPSVGRRPRRVGRVEHGARCVDGARLDREYPQARLRAPTGAGVAGGTRPL